MKKRADGRYRKTITIDGVKKSFYGKSEREVNRKILEFEREKEQGRPFSKVADEWWEDAYERISPNTVRGYRVAYQRAVEFFDRESITEISVKNVNAYLSHVARAGLSSKTVNNHKMVLSAILNYACELGEIDGNPCEYARIPKSAPAPKKRTAAPKTDEEKIRAAEDENRTFPVYFIALYTGMRMGEILGLTRGDIDLDNETITVERSVYYTQGAHVKEPKTEAGKRKIPIFSSLTDFLLRYKDLPPRAFICSEDGGKNPYSTKRIRTLEKHYHEATNTTFSMHQLRHSYTTIAVRAGVPLDTLQEILGHANIQTTMDVYNEVREDALNEARNALKNKQK